MMKLYYSGASPFVRKVLILAQEVGLRDAIRTVPVTLSPIAPDAELSKRNPLGKIPALELADGSTLYDSRVICEYLDGLHGGERHIPDGPARFDALRVQALADGVGDAAVLVRYETFLRPEALRWSDWTRGQCEKILAGLAALEGEVAGFGTLLDIGQIATLAMLGYLDFRRPLASHPDGAVDPRERFPKLFAWYEEQRKRPSMQSTEPR